MKVFIVGRPGCGKSRAARRLVKMAKLQGLSAERINDYPILRRMFRADTEGKQFKAIKGHDGFDVIDFTVLDTALKIVERKALALEKMKDIIVIEFARNDYEAAFHLFNERFLEDAYFLFINTDVETCIERICKRVINSKTSDDYFVSEDILRRYYAREFIPHNIETRFAIAPHHVRYLHNNKLRVDFDKETVRFGNFLLQQEEKVLYVEKVKKVVKKVASKFVTIQGIFRKPRISASARG